MQVRWMHGFSWPRTKWYHREKPKLWASRWCTRASHTWSVLKLLFVYHMRTIVHFSIPSITFYAWVASEGDIREYVVELGAPELAYEANNAFHITIRFLEPFQDAGFIKSVLSQVRAPASFQVCQITMIFRRKHTLAVEEDDIGLYSSENHRQEDQMSHELSPSSEWKWLRMHSCLSLHVILPCMHERLTLHEKKEWTRGNISTMVWIRSWRAWHQCYCAGLVHSPLVNSWFATANACTGLKVARVFCEFRWCYLAFFQQRLGSLPPWHHRSIRCNGERHLWPHAYNHRVQTRVHGTI